MSETTLRTAASSFSEALGELITDIGKHDPSVEQLSAMTASLAIPQVQEMVIMQWSKQVSKESLVRICDETQSYDMDTIKACLESAAEGGGENQKAYIKMLKLDSFFESTEIPEESKQTVWGHLRKATKSAFLFKITKAEIDSKKQMEEQNKAYQQAYAALGGGLVAGATAAAAATGNPVKTKPDIKNGIERAAEAIPKILEGVNDVMQKDGGNNPVAQIVNTLLGMQPGESLQAGLQRNMRQFAEQQSGEDTSLSSDLHRNFDLREIDNEINRLKSIRSKAVKRRARKKRKPKIPPSVEEAQDDEVKAASD
jgi:hypothetical protein